MSTNPDARPEPRDQQQAKLVDSLRAAAGAPVGFDELRDLGIERPAVLCYELEAAGLPITLTRAPDGRSTGARLEEREPPELHAPPNDRPSPLPALDVATLWRRLARTLGAAATAGRHAAERGAAGAHAISPRLSATARRLADAATQPRSPAASLYPMLAAVALIATLSATAILVIANPGRSGHRAAIARAQVRPAHGAPTQRLPRRAAPAPGREPAPVAPSAVKGAPVNVSPADATALQVTGHQQLADGRYGEAIGSLLAAIRASGQSLSGCTEPTTEACLTFAYALYDLGRALRLDGNPTAAVPVLRERLRIDNQRQVVEQELQLARGDSV